MATETATEYVVECLWPDVHESDLQGLDLRASEQAERLTAHGHPVGYLGSLLMREDEVVLCMFRGELETVRQVAVAADIPFERILETARSPWDMPSKEMPEGL